MRLLLVGNYGVGNLGDELLKEYFLEAFPEVEWTVVSANRVEWEMGNACLPPACRTGKDRQGKWEIVPRLPFGLRTLLLTPWWRTRRALRQCDAVVFGGGTLFTDLESAQAPFLWGWHAFVAWIFDKPILLAFQGVGPFRTAMGEWCTQWVVQRAAVTVVRDPLSFARVSGWKNKKCIHSFDPVLRLLEGKIEQHGNDRSQNVFAIIPRVNAGKEFLSAATSAVVREHTSRVRIISLEPDAPQEQVLCKQLAHAHSAEVVPVRSARDLLGALAGATRVLTARYHGAVAALALGIPFEVVAQGSGDKLASIQGTSLADALRLIEEGERALHEVFRTL